jgi:paraquat-inducible protein B
MMSGGISFVNPENESAKTSRPADEGKSFILNASYAQATKNLPDFRPPGTMLRLESSADNVFDVGSPVLYKWIPVGEVIDLALSDDHQKIVFDVLIHEKYAELVNASTLFYNFSGFSINADLSGVEIVAGPISTILGGGISFITPEQGGAIEDGHLFSLFKNYSAAIYKDSIPIVIHLDKADGIKEKTKITYQGIHIGGIQTIRFGPEMKGIVAEGLIKKEAEQLFRDTTRLWLVKPEIALSGVRHLDTVLTGPYIDIMPGTGAPRRDFFLLQESPATDSYAGLNIVLETPRLGSLNTNSPVYYRQVQVGRVTGFELSPTAQQVWVKVNIHPAYTNLVYTGTRFWLASGISASWGLFSGFDFSSESMEAILAGGIALATPDGEEMGELAVSNDHFTLDEKSEKTWLDWSPEIMLKEGVKETGDFVEPVTGSNRTTFEAKIEN